MPSEFIQHQLAGDRPPTRGMLEQGGAVPALPVQCSIGRNFWFEALGCLVDACTLFDADGRLLFGSRAYRRPAAIVLDQAVVGARLEDLVWAKVGPDEVATYRSATELFRRYLALHQHSDGTCEIVLRDGRCLRVRPWAVPTRPSLDRCGAIDLAVSRRHDGPAANRRARCQPARDHADASSDGLWETDQELRFTYLGEQFPERARTPNAHVIGRTCAGPISMSGVEPAKLQHGSDLEARPPLRAIDDCRTHPTTGAGRHVFIGGTPAFDRAGRFAGDRGTPTAGTAEVEATHNAARAQARLHEAIESINDGFAVFDHYDRLVICNRRFREIEALGAGVGPGTSWEEILRAGVARGHHADAHGRAEAYIAERLAHHRRADGAVLEHQLTDGRWIRIVECRTSDGGTAGTRADITEFKRREAARAELSDELRTQYSRFNAALNNMIQGLCMFDADHRLIVCNERYLQMYGFSPEVVKPGIRLREIMEYSVSLGNYRHEDAERAIAERPTTADKREQAVLYQRLNDGRVIAVMHQPMADGGSVATYEDVTQTVRAEEALRDYARKLERSNRELQDFASIASHDLQEPLRKIEAFGDRLKARCADDLSDVGRTYVERMQDAATRMRSLINDLLTYSQVTTKARPFVPIDLGQITAEVMSDLQVAIEQAGARIELGEIPVVEADPTQMRQLVQNLLSNALKFRRPGVPPVVRINGRVRAPADQGCGGEALPLCEVTVADNGIGFKPDHARRIFGIFQRLHGRDEYPGTGIGLATCRKILERHGGAITASGQPGSGATFVFTLPITQAREAVL